MSKRCPRCAHDLSFVERRQRRSEESTNNFHHRRIYECKNKLCPKEEIVYG